MSKKIILKLDIAKQTGWAISTENWYKNYKTKEENARVIDYGREEFWNRVPIIAGNKIDLMSQFIIKVCKEHEVDEIWYEELNYFRNIKTARSLLYQHSGAHFAALKLGIPIKAIQTQSSYRKQVAIRMLSLIGIKVDNTDIADALMLGEGR